MAFGLSVRLIGKDTQRASHTDLYIAETCRSRPVSCAHCLHWLTLAAVRCAPHNPFVAIADGIARSPELRCDACVSGILQHTPQLPLLNFIGQFHTKLEVQTAIIDTPAFVDAHVNAIFGISDQVI